MIKTVSIDRIKLNKKKYKTPPSDKKINLRIGRLKRGEKLKILIDLNYNLIDGYASYVAYKRLGYKYCLVEILDDKELSNIKGSLDYIYRRDKGRCYICGRQCIKGDNDLEPTIDHVVPLSKGGEDNCNNKRLACYTCNHLKADFYYSEELVFLIRNTLHERGLL